MQTLITEIKIEVEYTTDGPDLDVLSIFFIYTEEETTSRVKRALRGHEFNDSINILELLKEKFLDQIYEDCQADLAAQAQDAAANQAEAIRDERLLKEKQSHDPDW